VGGFSAWGFKFELESASFYEEGHNFPNNL
jgi:hypothetical protein